MCAWILGFLFCFPIVFQPLTIQSLEKHYKLNFTIADLINQPKTNKATQFLSQGIKVWYFLPFALGEQPRFINHFQRQQILNMERQSAFLKPCHIKVKSISHSDLSHDSFVDIILLTHTPFEIHPAIPSRDKILQKATRDRGYRVARHVSRCFKWRIYLNKHESPPILTSRNERKKMKMINRHAIFIQESDSHGGCVKEKFPAIYRNFVALYNNSTHFFLFTLF